MATGRSSSGLRPSERIMAWGSIAPGGAREPPAQGESVTGIWPTWVGLPSLALASKTQMQAGVLSATDNGTSIENAASWPTSVCSFMPEVSAIVPPAASYIVTWNVASLATMRPLMVTGLVAMAPGPGSSMTWNSGVAGSGLDWQT